MKAETVLLIVALFYSLLGVVLALLSVFLTMKGA